MGGRIGVGGSGKRDLDHMETHSSHYKMVLPHRSPLTQLMILNAHQRNQCCSPAFVKAIISEQFHVPKAMSTAKQVVRKCAVCALARSSIKKLEPPTGNIPEFRVPKPFGDECNRPYRICYYDFKGPIRVSDDRISKNTTAANPQAEEPQDQIKIYILSVTCAMTRHTTFEVTIDRSYENTKLAMLRVFYERGISRLLISDQEPVFKSIKKDFSDIETKETLDWLKGWKDSDQRKDLEQSYGTQFRFQHPESPENMGLVERLHKTITSSMLSLKQPNL